MGMTEITKENKNYLELNENENTEYSNKWNKIKEVLTFKLIVLIAYIKILEQYCNSNLVAYLESLEQK